MPAGHEWLDSHGQTAFRKRASRYVFNTALQSTLREMRALSSDARIWIALAMLALVIGLIGPFGTFEMAIPARLGYWSGVVLVTAITGTFFATLIEGLIGQRLQRLPRAALAGALAGIPVALVVVAMNLVVYGPVQPVHAAALVPYCVAICAVVTFAGVLFAGQGQTVADAQPALLDRLPLPQRGRLLHLAVADHYVEVTTERGRTLLLMRLSDAIRETAPVAGIQVHRSHWVALAAVRNTRRQAGKATLELENGTIVPISRSYLADAKAAGIA